MHTISSPTNAAVKAARKLTRRRARDATGEFLVESPQVIAEARGHLRRVFLADDADDAASAAARAAVEAGAELIEVTPQVLRSIATTSTPRGVVGVAVMPEPDLHQILDRARLVLLCVHVADPGNAGTIVRTADAAGADAVVLSEDSVDARNPKAVRASAGSIFHLPVVSGVQPRVVVAAAASRGMRTIAADVRGAVDHRRADWSGPTLVVLGGEAHGLPRTLVDVCDTSVRVEMFRGERPGYEGSAESLNLAATAALLAFEASRREAGHGGAADRGRSA